MRQKNFKVEDVLKAIKGSAGIKVEIARRLGCHRHTVDNYIGRYPTVARAYQEEVDSLGDMAEAQMANMIRGGFWPAVQFYLKTRCKDRGYVERAEVSGPDGGPVRVVFEETEQWRGGNSDAGPKLDEGPVEYHPV